jgi:hypothetical protein
LPVKKQLPIPPSILNHKYGQIFGAEWDMINNRMDGNSFNFFIGGNGTGKTYASLKRSEIVGVDEFDSYGKLFDPDHLEKHLFFDKQEMLNKIAELEKQGISKTKGYQIILDEAQMSANAKDWNNKEVLQFSKDMTTIRSSRLSICLTMPTHRMITTDLRQLGIYQVEMAPAETMNLAKRTSRSKLHFLKLNPHTGEIWRRNPCVKFEFKNPVTNFPLHKKGKLREVVWRLPSRTTRKNYELMKKAFKEIRAEQYEVKKEEQKEIKKSLMITISEAVRNNLSKYSINGTLSWAKIVSDFNCSDSVAYTVIRFIKKDMEDDFND